MTKSYFVSITEKLAEVLPMLEQNYHTGGGCYVSVFLLESNDDDPEYLVVSSEHWVVYTEHPFESDVEDPFDILVMAGRTLEALCSHLEENLYHDGIRQSLKETDFNNVTNWSKASMCLWSDRRLNNGISYLNNELLTSKEDVEQQWLLSQIDKAKDILEKRTTTEWCPYCDNEVELKNEFKVQGCPSCSAPITPCAQCPDQQCAQCPLN